MSFIPVMKIDYLIKHTQFIKGRMKSNRTIFIPVLVCVRNCLNLEKTQISENIFPVFKAAMIYLRREKQKPYKFNGTI